MTEDRRPGWQGRRELMAARQEGLAFARRWRDGGGRERAAQAWREYVAFHAPAPAVAAE